MKRLWKGSLSSSFHRWFIIFLLSATTLLAGCGTAPEAAGTPTRTPRPTRTSFPPTYTATSTSTPDPASFAAQTAQASTQIAWMSVYEATSSAAATLLAPFSGSCHQPPWLLSSDGDWLAANCYPNLEVATLDGATKVVVSYDEVYADLPEWPCAAGIVPLHWTQDDQTLFFSRGESCFDGAVVPPLADYLGPLYRLDVQTGQWTQIVVGQRYSSFFYSFSPTDRRLVYSQVYGAGRLPAIRILDLKTGELDIVEIPEFNELGGVTWSPNGLSFAFASMKFGENYTDESIRYSVFIYDVQSKSLTRIISESPERRIPQEWTSDDVLVIPLASSNFSFGIIPGQTIYYDLRTRTFFTPTPTP